MDESTVDGTDFPLLENTQEFLRAQLESRAPDTVMLQAWEQFYRVYDGLIRRFVWTHGIAGADVDDCVQEVWSAVVQKLVDFEHPRIRPGLRAWLYAVVRGKSIDLMRRKTVRHTESLDDRINAGQEPTIDGSDPAALYERAWTTALLKTLVDELRPAVPEVDFQVLQMRLLEGRRGSEVAAALNLTPEEVRYRKHRMLKKLRSQIAVYTGQAFGATR